MNNISSWIYILQLEFNKYYVGKTSNIKARIQSHFSGVGSEWTKKHKVIRVLEAYPCTDNYDEDKYTIQYMIKHGIDNVRGGSFSTIMLDSNKISFIKSMIATATNACFECGSTEHYAKNCTRRVLIDDFVLLSNCKNCGDGFTEDEYLIHSLTCGINKIAQSRKKCSRCGRNNHDVSKCFAKYHLNGSLIFS